MKRNRFILIAILTAAPLFAAVPDVIPFQGRVSVGSVNFSGTGQFKFAIYQQPAGGGAQTMLWTNSAGATNAALAEPATAAILTVTNGLYALALGDGVLSSPLPASLQPAAGNQVFLRIWFNDGTNGFQALSPDVPLNSVPFAREAVKAASADDAAKLGGQPGSFYLNRANHSGTIPTNAISGTYGQVLMLSNPSNAYAGNGSSLTLLNAGSLATGTVADARLSSNVALKNTANTFTGSIAYSGNAQTPLDLLSSNTGGSWANLRNSSAGGRAFNLIATGSGNGEGAGKLLIRDANAGAVRMTFDTDGDVGIGTTSPGAPLDVRVASGQTLQFRQDSGLVPGINVNSTGGNAGIMRLRNAMEIWPSDDGTRAGRLNVRNSAGTSTISLDGASGQIFGASVLSPSVTATTVFADKLNVRNSAGTSTISLDGASGQIFGASVLSPSVTATTVFANNLPAAKFASTLRDPRNSADNLVIVSGAFSTLDTITVTVPETGTLIFTVTANVRTTTDAATSPNPFYLKLEETTGGSSVQLVEIANSATSALSSNRLGTSATISWAQSVTPGTRSYQSVVTNSSPRNLDIDTSTLLVQFVAKSL